MIMNKLLLIALLFTSTTCAYSFSGKSKQIAVSPLLSSYYGIKNALVGADQPAAAQQANELVKAISTLDNSSLTGREFKLAKDLQEKIFAAAKEVATSKDLGTQRTAFSALSLSIYRLAKVIKLSDQPVYYYFCPMKKSYWLSSEAAIKNPYFGNQMLTCGAVKEILKP